MISFRSGRLTFLFISIFSICASANDGLLEINQACALNGGCFTGDSAGYPVTITQSGSYRLTGNLDLTNLAPVTAVQVSSPAVHVDLGGFEIIGPTTCTGTGPTLACNPTGTGQGVEFFTVSIGSSVRNGTIRGFGENGISANPEGIRISDITAIHNGSDGFAAVRSALIETCVAMENGGDGFDSDAGSVLKELIALGNGNHGIEIDDVGGLVSASTARSNGGRGFNIVALSKFGSDNLSSDNGQADSCGEGQCTTLRRYYFESGPFQGNEPAGSEVCDTGFHFASIWELADLGQLAFDHVRSPLSHDTGSGPPASSVALGWVRTGFSSVIADSPGFANCATWSSGASDHFGTVTVLSVNSGSVSPILGSIPWLVESASCDSDLPAWCIEDL